MASTKDGQWEHDSDDSQRSYEPPNNDKAPAPRAHTPRPSTYHLRDSSQIKRPGRYRVDEPVGALTHPTYIHPTVPFNKDLAKLIPWNTVPLNHPGPLSSDMAYERLLAERERKKNNPDAVAEVPFRPFQHVLDGESRPCVTHVSRKAPRQDPLSYLYKSDESIIDNTKFHPPSDKWSYRDEYNPESSLDDFGEDQDEAQRELERRRTAYVSWSSLSNGVKWAIVYDLSKSYSFTGATQLLSLSVDEILSFKKLYKHEKEEWDAYKARIVGEVQDALERAPNECARPFPRPDATPPPAPALELVTDSLSKDDLEKGRRFLKFIGMNQCASDLDAWYGSGSKFHEIPEVLDVDLDFFEEPRYRYPGPPVIGKDQNNLPRSAVSDPRFGPHVPENMGVGIKQPSRIFPPSPDMRNPALHASLRPLIQGNYNPDAKNLARQAFRHPFGSKRTPASRGAPPLNEGPASNPSNINHNWSNGMPIYMDLVLYDPIERVRLETERIRHNLSGNDRPARPQAHAGYRYATADDLTPGCKTAMRSHIAANANIIVPRVDKTAVLQSAEDAPAQRPSGVVEGGRMKDFALDDPSPNESAEEQGGGYAPKDEGKVANNTPQLSAAGNHITQGEFMQNNMGNASQNQAAGATPHTRTEDAGLASSYMEPHVDNPRHEDDDSSDPELDDFPPEKDDPNDRDYKQRKSGQRKKKPGSQKRTASKAQLGSDAIAARAPKKPCASRKKTKQSGSSSRENKEDILPETMTGGKDTLVTPSESPSVKTALNKAQKLQAAESPHPPVMGVMFEITGPARSPCGNIPQQTAPGYVPPNMQEPFNICSDSQLFEMGLLDRPPDQAMADADHSNHSASRLISETPVFPKPYGEFVAQVDLQAATQTLPYRSAVEHEDREDHQFVGQTGSEARLASEKDLS